MKLFKKTFIVVTLLLTGVAMSTAVSQPLTVFARDASIKKVLISYDIYYMYPNQKNGIKRNYKYGYVSHDAMYLYSTTKKIAPYGSLFGRPNDTYRVTLQYR